MYSAILELMDKSRVQAQKHQYNYKEIQKKITKLIKEEESWMKEHCEELEDLQQKHDQINLHKRITKITGTKTKNHQMDILVKNNNKQIRSGRNRCNMDTLYELFDDSRV